MFKLQPTTVIKSSFIKSSFVRLSFLVLLVSILSFSSCVSSGLYRGISGSAYISTSRPALSIEVTDLPLLTGAEGSVSLWESGMVGERTRVWLGIWGNHSGPLALVSHAELPEGWYWDGVMSHPFSVNEGMEIIANREWQAFTYIDKSRRSPFALIGVTDSDKSDSYKKMDDAWLVRAFTSRYNFDQDKIILEYREKLPAEIESLTSMPYGYSDYVKLFEERARTIFVMKDIAQSHPQIVRSGMSDKVQWRYLDGRFLGSASRKSMDNLR